MEVRVVALSGKELATFSVEASCTVAEVARKTAAAAGPWPGSVYALMLGDRVLEISDTLAQAVGQAAGLLELQAVASPCVVLELPDVKGAAQLPGTGDLVIATHGPLVGAAGSSVPRGSDVADGVAACEFWIWRLTKASGWSVSSGELVARISSVQLYEVLNYWRAERSSSRDPCLFSAEVLAGDVQDVRLPDEGKCPSLLMHVHSDAAVVLAWNRRDYWGGQGIIRRLDLPSGEVTHVANVSDLVGVATNPADGTIYCKTCYDGSCILRLQGGSILQPGNPAEHEWFMTVQLPILGHGLAYDAKLGILVTDHNRSFFAACPPDSPFFEHLASAPGVGVLEALRPLDEDHTPGNRSAPWRLLELQLAHPQSHKQTAQSHDASLFVDAGVLIYLEPAMRETVLTVPLVPPPGGWMPGSQDVTVTKLGAAAQLLCFSPGTDHPCLAIVLRR